MKNGNEQGAVDLTACKKVRIQKNDFDFSERPLIDTLKLTKKDLEPDLKMNMQQ